LQCMASVGSGCGCSFLACTTSTGTTAPLLLYYGYILLAVYGYVVLREHDWIGLDWIGTTTRAALLIDLLYHIMLKTEDFLLALQRYCRYHTDGHSSGHGWTGRPCHIAMSCRTLTLYVLFSSSTSLSWASSLVLISWVGRSCSVYSFCS
jgi:hypothetical protein